jgi:hypothetical protein
MIDLSVRNEIILPNVPRNHAYHIAEAAENAGYPKKVVTSIYHKPSSLLGRAMRSSSARSSRCAALAS